MKKLSTLLFIFILHACSTPQQTEQTPSSSYTIAFGSCSVQDWGDKQLWQEVLNENPDLWIWLGDNIYGDTEDMTVMKSKYDLQKSHPDYQQLISQTDIIGIWDDHDFGANDAGSEYPMKDESRDLLFDFLDVDPDNEAWKRKGAYQSYSYIMNENGVKIILLDTRYYRDSLIWEKEPKRSLVNENGGILGEEQWQWFQNELNEEEIDFFIIGSGIQVITQDHDYEKWSNFPKDRERLLQTVSSIKVPLLFLSGDRHISEVTRLELENYPFPLYDLTSSSLTSPWGEESDSPNENREGEIVYPVNFAVMKIDWNEKRPSLRLKFTGKDNAVLQEFAIDY
ncbi:MAG: alkaline phosphatase D family protein [Cyclobacteriaceae bacterium]